MKVTATASAIRAQMTPTEARDIVALVVAAEQAGLEVPSRLIDAAALLDIRAGDIRRAQASKATERHIAKRIAANGHTCERQFNIGGNYSVMASLGDYADLSRDPDFRQWSNLVLREIMAQPIPDQCEIRRDVWLVRVIRLQPGDWGGFTIAGSDCTATADPEEIEAIAHALIAAAEASQSLEAA